MIFRRILLELVAATMFSAAAGVIVVALAFALYALMEPYLGKAGAAATVALATAILTGLAGMIMAMVGRNKRSRLASSLSGGVLERVIAFVRQKPIVAASAAIGAGLMATRNPKYLGEALRAFLEGDPKVR